MPCVDSGWCSLPYSQEGAEFCKANFADFWPADSWLSSSPDLNPLDDAAWGVLEQATNKTSHSNIEEEWAKMPKEFVVKSCVAFRGRAEAVMECNRSHIEYIIRFDIIYYFL